MKSQVLNIIIGVVAVACLVGETIAQTSGPLAGLDELLGKQKNLTIFRSYLRRYPQVLADVKAGDGITILAPDDTAMTARIPASILKVPFETNDTNVIINALQYHVMLGTQKDGSLVNSLLQNRKTLLTDSKYSNQTGGERVTYFKAWDKVVTFISGLGTRCTLITPDLEFSNGVVHIIDSPVIPPQPFIPTTSQYNLTGFQGSLFAAGQTEQLTKAKTITLFAPRNDAFQALGSAISTMTAEQIGKVMSYHAISNETIYSPDLKNGSTLITSSGQKLNVRIFGNLMFINSAQVTEKDILIANGVIHTIDSVLNPDDAGGVPNPDIATQKPVFPAATAAAEVPFTSAIPCTTACQTPGATGAAGGKGSSSKAAAPPRETGFSGAVKLAAAVVGGAVMMI